MGGVAGKATKISMSALLAGIWAGYINCITIHLDIKTFIFILVFNLHLQILVIFFGRD